MAGKSKKKPEIWTPEFSGKNRLPFVSSTISAGFPSPADDYLEQKLDLNDLLVRHPSATFFVKAKGTSMINAGIHDGDILVVDRSLAPGNKSIVIGVVDGEFTVKRILKDGARLFLLPENDEFKKIEITKEMDFSIWGVVSHVIHKV